MNRIDGNLPTSMRAINALLKDPEIWTRIVAGGAVSEEHGRWMEKQRELRKTEEKNMRLMEWRMNEARKMQDRAEEVARQRYKSGITTLVYASEEMKNDPDVIMAAVRQDFSLASTPVEKRNNYKLVMAAVESDGHELRFAPDALRNNITIVHAAVKNKEDSIKYASLDIQQNVLRRIYFLGAGIEETVALFSREYVELLERLCHKPSWMDEDN